MMLADPVARVYAEALFDLARGRDVVEDTAVELEAFHDVVGKEPRIERFLVTPVIEPDAKVARLKAALPGRVSDLVTDFL
jgi:F-type H+-transporting ATPase subunit delta